MACAAGKVVCAPPDGPPGTLPESDGTADPAVGDPGADVPDAVAEARPDVVELALDEADVPPAPVVGCGSVDGCEVGFGVGVGLGSGATTTPHSRAG